MLHAHRLPAIAAPSSLLVALVGFAILAAPLPTHAHEAELAFEHFTGNRVQILRARALRASTHPEVRPGAERPVITYRAIGESFDTDLEATGVSEVPFVGALHYTELVFSCEAVDATHCVEVASRPVTEIFRYREGVWGH
jgi:hypothetical protein